MAINAIYRTTIGLCILYLVAFASLKCFAQCGANASPYDNCNCVPARPYWGYYKTNWHRWPGVLSTDGQTPAGPGAEGVQPPQTELPSPKSEAESKPAAPSGTAAPSTKASETAPPTEAPTNPFQAQPSKPSELAPEQAPEKNEGTKEPGTAEPGMEMPGTEPPKESPAAPSDTNQPSTNEAPLLPPGPNELKPSEKSLEPNSNQQSSGGGMGAFNMAQGLRLRHCAVNDAGHQNQSLDSAPVMPAACNVVKKEVSPNSVGEKSSAQSTLASEKRAPNLIGAVAAQRLEPTRSDTDIHRTAGNPLRTGDVKPSNWMSEQRSPEAAQSCGGEAATFCSSTNPLRPN